MTPEMLQAAFAFFVFNAILVFYTQCIKPATYQKADPFQIPKTGGALQLMEKDDDNNIGLQMSERIKLTDDTYIFRFKFESDMQTFGLPIGNHVIFSADIAPPGKDEKELVQRKYTPISRVT